MIGSRYGVLIPVLLLAAMVLMVRPVAAQEVSVGYQFERISAEGFDAVNLPLGAVIDIAAPVGGGFDVVGSFDWSRRSDSAAGQPETMVNYYTFSGGVRLSAAMASGVRPFAQVLFGATRIAGSTKVNGNEVASSATTRPMLDIGGGAALPLGDATSLFGEAAYRRIFTEGIRQNGVRLVAGVRFGFAVR